MLQGKCKYIFFTNPNHMLSIFCMLFMKDYPHLSEWVSQAVILSQPHLNVCHTRTVMVSPLQNGSIAFLFPFLSFSLMRLMLQWNMVTGKLRFIRQLVWLTWIYIQFWSICYGWDISWHASIVGVKLCLDKLTYRYSKIKWKCVRISN